MVKCDNFTEMLLVITVTANSNKWQQALGFVSCAQVFPGVKRLEKHREPLKFKTWKREKKKASVDQPESEYQHLMVNTHIQIQVHRLWHFLAAITNTKVYQKKTLHVLKSE